MLKSCSGHISTRSTKRLLHYLPLLARMSRWPLLYAEKGLGRTRATGRLRQGLRWESEITPYADSVLDELSIADMYMDVNRLGQSRHLSHAYSMERSARLCVWQANLTQSQSIVGDHYSSTSRSVAPVTFFPCKYPVTYLEFVPTARFCTYRSRRTNVCTARAIRPENWRSEPASHGTL